MSKLLKTQWPLTKRQPTLGPPNSNNLIELLEFSRFVLMKFLACLVFEILPNFVSMQNFLKAKLLLKILFELLT